MGFQDTSTSVTTSIFGFDDLRNEDGSLGFNGDAEVDAERLQELANTAIDALLVIALIVAIASLSIIAIRIMIARATGDVNAAKVSSNGIGWVIFGVLLAFSSPALIRFVVSSI